MATETERERDEWKACAERLAAALRELGFVYCASHCDGDDHTDECTRARAALPDFDSPPCNEALDDLIAAVMRGVDQVTRDLLERAHVSLADEKTVP